MCQRVSDCPVEALISPQPLLLCTHSKKYTFIYKASVSYSFLIKMRLFNLYSLLHVFKLCEGLFIHSHILRILQSFTFIWNQKLNFKMMTRSEMQHLAPLKSTVFSSDVGQTHGRANAQGSQRLTVKSSDSSL